MNRFIIVRHGETLNNLHGRLSGWIDTPLTEKGLEPTKLVAQKLNGVKFDAIYSSDLGRAFITAYYLTEWLNQSLKITMLPGLREVNYGLAANMIREEAYRTYPCIDSDTHYHPPKGESLHEMQTRVIDALVQLNSHYQESTILLVCHSGDMAALNAAFQGIDFGGHNISEAYPHDYIAEVTVVGKTIATFHEYRPR